MTTTQTEKAQHTPGPWAIEECGVGELFVVQPDGGGGHWAVCEMSADGDWANARLIAESPTMCKTLRQFAAWADDLSPAILNAELGAAVINARAILARIEGKK